MDEYTEWFITPIILDVYDPNISSDIELESEPASESESEPEDRINTEPASESESESEDRINTDTEANQIKLNKCRIISYCNNS